MIRIEVERNPKQLNELRQKVDTAQAPRENSQTLTERKILQFLKIVDEILTSYSEISLTVAPSDLYIERAIKEAFRTVYGRYEDISQLEVIVPPEFQKEKPSVNVDIELTA